MKNEIKIEIDQIISAPIGWAGHVQPGVHGHFGYITTKSFVIDSKYNIYEIEIEFCWYLKNKSNIGIYAPPFFDVRLKEDLPFSYLKIVKNDKEVEHQELEEILLEKFTADSNYWKERIINHLLSKNYFTNPVNAFSKNSKINKKVNVKNHLKHLYTTLYIMLGIFSALCISDIIMSYKLMN